MSSCNRRGSQSSGGFPKLMVCLQIPVIDCSSYLFLDLYSHTYWLIDSLHIESITKYFQSHFPLVSSGYVSRSNLGADNYVSRQTKPNISMSWNYCYYLTLTYVLVFFYFSPSFRPNKQSSQGGSQQMDWCVCTYFA